MSSRTLITFAFFLMSSGTSTSGSLIPITWNLGTSINDDNDTVGAGFFAPAANFNDSHTVNHAGSISSAAYAIVIANGIANYVIQTQHSCLQNNDNRPRCISSGRITLTPSVDTLLTADMTYAYFMPTDPMDVVSSVSVVLLNPGQALLGEGRHDYTDLIGPHGGTQEIHTSVVLPAGRTARIQYSQEISYTIGSATGLTGTGDGTIHLTMTELPEPGSFALLGLATLPLIHRRRRN